MIRVCRRVANGKVDPDASSYLVDAAPAPHDASASQPRHVPSRSNPYPHAAREQGAEGHVTLRIRLDEGGRVAAADVREHTAGPLFRTWLERWRADAKFEIPSGWPRAGEPRSLDMRIAFAIAPRLASAPTACGCCGGSRGSSASPISSRP